MLLPRLRLRITVSVHLNATECACLVPIRSFYTATAFQRVLASFFISTTLQMSWSIAAASWQITISIIRIAKVWKYFCDLKIFWLDYLDRQCYIYVEIYYEIEIICILSDWLENGAIMETESDTVGKLSNELLI